MCFWWLGLVIYSEVQPTGAPCHCDVSRYMESFVLWSQVGCFPWRISQGSPEPQNQRVGGWMDGWMREREKYKERDVF